MKSWGTDPELMLKDGEAYVSAINVVPACPENRLAIKGHEFYYDNVMAEFAMKPATSKQQALDHMKECLELYVEVVSPCKLVIQAYQDYPDNIWDNLNEATGKPLAATAGCAIDRCGYLVRDMDPPKELIETTTARSGGGHIHLGDVRLNRDYGLWLAPSVILMDLLIGVPSLFLDKDPTSPKRRSLYGQAGRYRICTYGMEYRTLGNFWLASPKLTGLMYDLCEFVCDLVCSDRIQEYCIADPNQYASARPARAYTYTFDVKKLKAVINKSNTKKSGCEFYDFALSLLPKGLAADVNSLLKGGDYDLYKEWDL
tara:strand:+ start:8599 stop:9540 length:942 start_codon:yes stop_codon:yes gene_type:complete